MMCSTVVGVCPVRPVLSMDHTATFPFTNDTNILDLQHHIRAWFRKLCITDSFMICHQSNRFSILNIQGPKGAIKLADLNLSPRR